MPKWFKPTALAVLIFLGLYTCMDARADTSVEVGYGYGMVSTNEYKMQSVTFAFDEWYVEYERQGGRRRDTTTGNMVTAGRYVETEWGNWRPRLGFGVSYGDKLQEHGKKEGRYLVNEKFTFDLRAGIGYQISSSSRVALQWVHNSTGGRSKPNSGVDRIRVSYKWEF